MKHHMSITVWVKSDCVQCEQTKKMFDKLGVDYLVQSLEENPLMVEGFREQGLMAAPIVITDTGMRWSGFRLDKIQSLARHLKSMGESES